MTELKTRETSILSDDSDDCVKHCAWCGELFFDNTKPKNKKTCSKDCGDSLRKQKQRDKYAADTAHIPRKPTQYEIYQMSHSEYPFWETRVMQNLAQKHESLQPTDKVERIIGRRQIDELIGGRRKKSEVISYDGDEKGSHGVSVRFAEHDDKEPGEVTTYKMTAEEMDRYFAETYRKRR
ncbi:hypothetical protein [Sporosarcina newyorkensis]|uniref:Uncharacterized protein n=1 Tax=Sporosarcina newyorkensis TaxID=759851 RepID=A0A1T4XHW8_9BACL|nr:hypothetical protein [Sporosarcina newyorkensis]SKA88711.1 hypothetical protein SAMN04244570_0728 [Sporosarcina newyorkensis]